MKLTSELVMHDGFQELRNSQGLPTGQEEILTIQPRFGLFAVRNQRLGSGILHLLFFFSFRILFKPLLEDVENHKELQKQIKPNC